MPHPTKPKVFLVSDPLHFALTDVYYGYVHAFEKLGVDCTVYPLHQFLQHHKEHICMSVIHSEALIKENGYTHVFFVGGLNIPTRILESFPGNIKVGVIATEDPHNFEPNLERIKVFDYYFTNERALLNKGLPNLYYVPTAGDNVSCGALPREMLDSKYHSDILFLGAVYPNRYKMLKSLVPLVKENNLKMKIMGHPHLIKKDSPLWEFIPPENFDKNGKLTTIPHEESVKYYNGAKLSLNFFRDVTWHPLYEKGQVNPFYTQGVSPESLNPRAYEVPLCGSFMLLEDTRSEAREVFSEDEVGFFKDTRQLKSQVKKFLLKSNSSDLRVKMSQKAFVKVSTQHTYLNRAQSILNIINRVQG